MALTVTAINHVEQKQTKAGKPFQKYRLELEGQGEVQFADFENVRPSVGYAFGDGWAIEDSQFGREVKKAGRKSANGKSDNQAQITRQGAQQRAGLFLIAQALHGNKYEFNRDQFKQLVDWFVEDAEGRT